MRVPKYLEEYIENLRINNPGLYRRTLDAMNGKQHAGIKKAAKAERTKRTKSSIIFGPSVVCI